MNTISKVVDFLNDELDTTLDGYYKTLRTDCRSLFDLEKLFRVKLIKTMNSGIFKIKFKADLPIPRASSNEYYLIFLRAEDRKKGAIDEISYENLLSKKTFSLQGKVIKYFQDNDSGNEFIYAHFSISENDSEKINSAKSYEECYAYLGEVMPPVEMLNNLRIFSNNHPEHRFFKFKHSDSSASIYPLSCDNTKPEALLNLCNKHSPLIIQGPPGTGKSYLISALTSKLILMNKSVLVTTLANRALIEIVQKDHLKESLANHKIFKYAVSNDELRRVPELQSLKKILPVRGEVHFSTYYSASGSDLLLNPSLEKYDYVLVDEAGQAFLPYLAATTFLGKKQLFIGDINQLPPVTVLNPDTITSQEYASVINGLEVISSFNPSFQLTSTYRLNHHSASCSQIFYKYNLQSMNLTSQQFSLNLLGRNFSFTPGTYVISFPNDYNYKLNTLSVIKDLCSQFNDFKPENDKRIKSKIAIMSYKVNDVNYITRSLKLITALSDERVIIDTVHRCQGLTAHFAIFLITNNSLFSLGRQVFNVATSRAKIASFIIIPESLLSSAIAQGAPTGIFLKKLLSDKHYISLH